VLDAPSPAVEVVERHRDREHDHEDHEHDERDADERDQRRSRTVPFRGLMLELFRDLDRVLDRMDNLARLLVELRARRRRA
jgi:hypothetical protein